MVLFAKEGTDLATYFSGQDYVDMKDSDAVFIAVPYTSDRTPAPGAKETLVPICKLSSDNPARDYDIRVGEEAVLVLDCFGNFDDVGSKFSKKPTSKELKDTLQRLPSKVESLNKKLDKSLAAANTALSKGDRNAAFKAAVKILESGTVGYGAASEAAKMYNTICDEVRTEVAALKEAEDKKEAQKKLGELAGVFTKKAAPSVASEIAAAKKEVAAVAK
ncbi:MAG: hypothetical protein IT462_13675 [Planctomycetes bacterium]|nr:hypothetical protein [Planctomycetota bacterium]